MAFDKSKFIARFAEEAQEHISKLNDGLVHLESNPGDTDTLNQIFRSAHTIKGSSKILNLKEINEVSHNLEDSLDALRDQRIQQTAELFDLLFKAVDMVSDFVNKVQAGETVSADVSEICSALEKASKGGSGKDAPAKATPPPPPPPPPPQEPKPKIQTEPSGINKSKFVNRFCEEAREHIGKLNDGLVHLESNPGDMDTLNQIFRSAHTIKGSSKILNLKEINEVSHKLEDTLDGLRESKLKQSNKLFDIIFRAVDMIADFVERVQEGSAIETDITEICEALGLASQGKEFVPLAPKPAQVESEPESKTEPVEEPEEEEKDDESEDVPTLTFPPKEAVAKQPAGPTPSKPKPTETVRISTDKLDETVKLMGEIVSNHIRMKQNLVDIDELGRISKKYLEVAEKVEEILGENGNGTAGEVMDYARSMHNHIRQLSANSKDVLNFQTLLTDELREKVLKMRMLPLSMALDAFPRLVRDLAASCNKRVKFLVEGAETELDKKIIEKIGDPLLHMIRNSIDHGIESPEERVQKGKPEMGTLRLTAGYEGGSVLIQLKDDGAGIPVEKIKEKALKKKIYDEETLNRMPQSEIINLIFKPGFSTSAIITDVSGRGVGMDVVRDNIVMQLKGAIQVVTEEGTGTQFFIRLPLTLAVMRILLVTVSGFKFAIPLNMVNEIVRIQKSEIIEVVNKRAISLRDQIIPLGNLDELLKVPVTDKTESDEILIVMVSMGNESLGLIVDSIISEEDMEIKSLPTHMKNNEMVSGVTLSGKNEIVLVLHVPKLFSLAKEIQGTKKEAEVKEVEQQSARILVVDDSLSTREIEKNILESYGYQVDVASDGIEGLEKAKARIYDMIITDIEMPRMDGFSLTENLRNETQYEHTPIIIVSSREKEEDKRRGMQVGADAYIIKGSFDQSNLLDTIQSLIE